MVGTYTHIRESIEPLFASQTWTKYNIPTYPANYYGAIDTKTEHVRLQILPAKSGFITYYGDSETKGLIIVNIFVEAGKGQRRVFEISDALDELLEAKKLHHDIPPQNRHGTLITQTSYLTFLGLDPDNKSLYRADYTLPFTKFTKEDEFTYERGVR